VSGEAKRKPPTLDAYPCPVGIGLMCNAECRDAIDRCEATICLWLPMYRQAVADHKCARLLRTFEVNLGTTFERSLADVISRIYRYGWPGLKEWRRTLWQFTRLRRYIRDALREAGL